MRACVCVLERECVCVSSFTKLHSRHVRVTDPTSPLSLFFHLSLSLSQTYTHTHLLTHTLTHTHTHTHTNTRTRILTHTHTNISEFLSFHPEGSTVKANFRENAFLWRREKTFCNKFIFVAQK